MRVSSVSNSIGVSYVSDVKKPLSLEILDYLKNYSGDNLKHRNKEIQEDDKPIKLLDHQTIFNFDTEEDEYVSKLYGNTNDLMNELENMIFNLSSTSHLKNGYEELKFKNMIKFGTHNDNSEGFIEYNKNDIQDTEIFITTDQSIIGVASTLVHELQHQYDLNYISKQQNQQTDTFTLEINAFGIEYKFLEEGNYIYDESYTKLSQVAKDVYTNTKDFIDQNTQKSENVEFLSSILVQIGYEKKEQFEKEFISSKDIELSRVVDVSNDLNRMVFNSKIKII